MNAAEIYSKIKGKINGITLYKAKKIYNNSNELIDLYQVNGDNPLLNLKNGDIVSFYDDRFHKKRKTIFLKNQKVYPLTYDDFIFCKLNKIENVYQIPNYETYINDPDYINLKKLYDIQLTKSFKNEKPRIMDL